MSDKTERRISDAEALDKIAATHPCPTIAALDGGE